MVLPVLSESLQLLCKKSTLYVQYVLGSYNSEAADPTRTADFTVKRLSGGMLSSLVCLACPSVLCQWDTAEA